MKLPERDIKVYDDPMGCYDAQTRDIGIAFAWMFLALIVAAIVGTAFGWVRW